MPPKLSLFYFHKITYLDPDFINSEIGYGIILLVLAVLITIPNGIVSPAAKFLDLLVCYVLGYGIVRGIRRD